MRRLLAFLVLCAAPAVAQPPIFVGGGGSSGSVAPGSFSSPTGTITVGGSSGAVTLDAATSVLLSYVTGTSDPATCTTGSIFNLRTDSTLLKFCTTTNTWTSVVTDNRLTDCQDTGGNHLNYNSSTGAWSCGTSSSGFAPRTSPIHYSEFLDCSGTTNTSSCGFFMTVLASGTLAAAASPSADHPGAVAAKSSASAGSGLLFRTDNASIIFGGGETLEIGLYFDSLTNTTSYIGFHDSVTAATDATDGCYYEVAGTTVTGKCANNSSRTSTSSTYTASATTWYRLKIALNAGATVATFTIYSAAGSQLWTDTVSANIPTARAFGITLMSTQNPGGTANLTTFDYSIFTNTRSYAR